MTSLIDLVFLAGARARQIDLAKRVLHVRTEAGVKKFGLPIGTVIHAREGQTLIEAAKALKKAIDQRGVTTQSALEAMAANPVKGDRFYSSNKEPGSEVFTYAFDGEKWTNLKTGTTADPAKMSEIVGKVFDKGEKRIWAMQSDLPPAEIAKSLPTKPLGPTDAEKVANAATMFGTGSPKHKAAVEKFSISPALPYTVSELKAQPVGTKYVTASNTWTKVASDTWAKGESGVLMGDAVVTADGPGSFNTPGTPDPLTEAVAEKLAPNGGKHAPEDFAAKPVGAEYVSSGLAWKKKAPDKWYLSETGTMNSDAAMGLLKGTFTEPPKANLGAPGMEKFFPAQTFADQETGTQFHPVGEATYTKTGVGKWTFDPAPVSSSTDFGMASKQGYFTKPSTPSVPVKPLPTPPDHKDFEKPKLTPGTQVTGVETLDALPVGSRVSITSSSAGTDFWTKTGSNEWTITFGSEEFTATSKNFSGSIADQTVVVEQYGPQTAHPPETGTYLDFLTLGTTAKDSPIGTKYTPPGSVVDGPNTWVKIADNQWESGDNKGYSKAVGTDAQVDGYKAYVLSGQGAHEVNPSIPPPPTGKHTPPGSAMDKSPEITSRVGDYASIPGNTDLKFPARDYEETRSNFGGTYLNDELSDKQSSRISAYSGSWAGSINTLLRDGGGLNDPGVAVMDSAMCPVSKPTMFFRSLPTTSVGVGTLPTTEDVVKEMKKLVGKEITDKGYLSSSYSLGGSTVSSPYFSLRIHAPKGTPAVFAEPFSGYKGENEVVLSRGLPMRVDSVEWNRAPNGNNHIILNVTALPAKVDPELKARFGKSKTSSHKAPKVHKIPKTTTSGSTLEGLPKGTVIDSGVNIYVKDEHGMWTSSDGGLSHASSTLAGVKWEINPDLSAGDKSLSFQQLVEAPEGSTLMVDGKVSLTKKNGSWENEFGQKFNSAETEAGKWTLDQFKKPSDYGPGKHPLPPKHLPVKSTATVEKTKSYLDALPIGATVQPGDKSATYEKTAPDAKGYEWRKLDSPGSNYSAGVLAKYVPLPKDDGQLTKVKGQIQGVSVGSEISTSEGGTEWIKVEGGWEFWGNDPKTQSWAMADSGHRAVDWQKVAQWVAELPPGTLTLNAPEGEKILG